MTSLRIAQPKSSPRPAAAIDLPDQFGNPIDTLRRCKRVQIESTECAFRFPAGDFYLGGWADWAVFHQTNFDRNMRVPERLTHYLQCHARGDWGDLPHTFHSLNSRALEVGRGRVISCFQLDTLKVPYFQGVPNTPLIVLTDLDYETTIIFVPIDLRS